MTEAEAFLASIRTRVGQIKKAQRTPTVDAWGQIEVACDKLLDAAGSFERSLSAVPPANPTEDVG
jgi:hypothetical protein